MQLEKTCLIITGCIAPKGDVPNLAVKNSDERRKQYMESFVFYITQTSIQMIIFCDNSGSAIDEEIIKMASGKGKIFEWLSFKGNFNKTLTQGKGYGEGEIVRYVLENSKIISKCETFIKVTGRLNVKNIDRCISAFENKYSYFDFHKNFVDTRCYIMNIGTYKQLFFDSYKKVSDKDGFYLEMAMFSDIPEKDRRFKQIPFYLDIVGQSGSTGAIMRSPNMIIRGLKNIKRVVIVLYIEWSSKKVPRMRSIK